MALYSPAMWPNLTDGLTELSQGRATTRLRWPTTTPVVTAKATTTISNDADTAINCGRAAYHRPGNRCR